MLDEVAEDRLCAGSERCQAVPPSRPELVSDAVFLQAQREQLLGDDVPRLGRTDHRLHPAATPQVQQRGGLHEGIAVADQK